MFATNTLVVVYPKSNPGNVKTVFDLRRPGLKVVIARQGVPVGDYTRTVLRNLGISRAVLANVVSQEPDVRSVLAKVALGEADAGFVYRTDAATVKKRRRRHRLPTRAQPPIRYGICVVSSSDEQGGGPSVRARGCSARPGRARLTAAGFGVPAARVVMRRSAFNVALVLALCLTLAFFLLPIAAVFLRVPPGELLDQLGSDVVLDALVVTAKTSLIAQAIIFLVGTPAAYLVARRRFRGRAVVLTLIELPLVLPPAVAGIGLLAAFGRLGLLGSSLDFLGVSVGFTQAAVVMAILLVAGPFYVRGAVGAFESLDENLLDASRTLGAGPGPNVLRALAIPLAAPGLSAAAALSFARGLGEFGATLFFAGSLQGVTQTLPLAIYAELDVSFDTALAISALLIVISACVLLLVKLLPLWKRSDSQSTFPVVPSA